VRTEESAQRPLVVDVLLVTGVDDQPVGTPGYEVVDESGDAVLACGLVELPPGPRVDAHLDRQSGDRVGQGAPAEWLLFLEVQFALAGHE